MLDHSGFYDYCNELKGYWLCLHHCLDALKSIDRFSCTSHELFVIHSLYLKWVQDVAFSQPLLTACMLYQEQNRAHHEACNSCCVLEGALAANSCGDCADLIACLEAEVIYWAWSYRKNDLVYKMNLSITYTSFIPGSVPLPPRCFIIVGMSSLSLLNETDSL